MTTLEADVRPSSLAPATPWLVPALYAVTLFASALLLFVLQPMFAKMVLPRLGGAQSVWSVAMVFFQGALLLGYGYAHLLSRTLPPGRAALMHLIVLATAALALPIGIATCFDVRPSWLDRLSWAALAAVPSGLVIAVTSFVTADLAAAPFLWVFPLAMYLATFVAVFRERAWFAHATMVALAPLAVAPVAVTL